MASLKRENFRGNEEQETAAPDTRAPDTTSLHLLCTPTGRCHILLYGRATSRRDLLYGGAGHDLL